jgi:hypothetical protein
VAAFIDILGPYDNVLIDILCGILRKKELSRDKPFILAEGIEQKISNVQEASR